MGNLEQGMSHSFLIKEIRRREVEKRNTKNYGETNIRSAFRSTKCEKQFMCICLFTTIMQHSPKIY